MRGLRNPGPQRFGALPVRRARLKSRQNSCRPAGPAPSPGEGALRGCPGARPRRSGAADGGGGAGPGGRLSAALVRPRARRRRRQGRVTVFQVPGALLKARGYSAGVAAPCAAGWRRGGRGALGHVHGGKSGRKKKWAAEKRGARAGTGSASAAHAPRSLARPPSIAGASARGPGDGAGARRPGWCWPVLHDTQYATNTLGLPHAYRPRIEYRTATTSSFFEEFVSAAGKKIVSYTESALGGFGDSFARFSFHPAARNETLLGCVLADRFARSLLGWASAW